MTLVLCSTWVCFLFLLSLRHSGGPGVCVWAWSPSLLQSFQVSCLNCLPSAQSCLGSSRMRFWETAWPPSTWSCISSPLCKCRAPGGRRWGVVPTARESRKVLRPSVLQFISCIIRWFLSGVTSVTWNHTFFVHLFCFTCNLWLCLP